ncbi:MAG: hypothetical protein ACR2LV_02610 [Solirubrobacteraceae bacterium]
MSLIDIISLLLGLMGVVVGAVAIRFAVDAQKRLRNLDGALSDGVDGLGRRLDQLAAQAEVLADLAAQLKISPATEDEADADSQTEEDAPTQHGDVGPEDIVGAVANRAGTVVLWTVRRPGRGRPRWLAGTDDASTWGATRRRGIPYVYEDGFGADTKLLPLPGLRDEVAVGLRQATELGSLEGTFVYQEDRAGAGVYYVVVPDEQNVWRVSHTRWGWSGIPYPV